MDRTETSETGSDVAAPLRVPKFLQGKTHSDKDFRRDVAGFGYEPLRTGLEAPIANAPPVKFYGCLAALGPLAVK